MTTELEELIVRARSVTTAGHVRADAIAAIRAVERALIDCVKVTGVLRGMHNLGSRETPIIGMRVRCQMPDQRIPFSAEGDKHLILGESGTLALVKAIQIPMVIPGRGGFTNGWHAVRGDAADHDLLIEDMEHVVRTATIALTRHLAETEGPAERYRSMRDMAHKLIDIL
jgi:hypothetical protein